MINKENRKLKKIKCSFCGDFTEKREAHIKSTKNSFCSPICQSLFYKTGKHKECSYCGSSTYKTNSVINRSKSGNYFCNRSCATSYNNSLYRSGVDHPNFRIDSGTYRKKALKYYGLKCMNPNCNLTRSNITFVEKMLDVDHIDSDRKNNSMDNLQVLCVLCHALKTRGVP